jgi:hypothetical protein
MKICVYCSSSAQVDSKYFEATKSLANIFTKAKIEVVFGKIKSGYLYIDYVDIVQEEHKAVVELVFDEIVNEEGLKFSPMVDLTEAGTFSEEFDLSGYFIKTT